MPKSVQHKNVNITIYNTPSMPTLVIKEILDFTHAFFPKERFEQVKEKDGWVFGKSGDGYVGIYSKNGYRWQSEGDYAHMELIAEGKKNIWITEVGRKASHGSFETFIRGILTSQLKFNGDNVVYHSKLAGKIATGWKSCLRVNGQLIDIKNYARYDNQACLADYASDFIELKFKGETHKMTI